MLMEVLSFLKAITRLITILVSLVMGMALCACASNPPNNEDRLNANSPAEINTLFGKQYKIGPDDQLKINVWKNKELSVVIPVRPDGKISMPLIGDVQAAGLEPEDVARNITEKLAKYIREPNVTVMVTELRSHEYLSRVRVTGAVEKPISLPYRQGMTVLDAVLAAGGINEFAAPNNTKLFRKTRSGTDIIEIQLGKILYKGHLKTNVILRPGDIITVPERLF
jgi:polysaccharide export outer membrane protein